MATGQSSKGAAVGVLAIGALLMWSAIKGKQVTMALRDLIAGKSPLNAPGTPISGAAYDTAESSGGAADVADPTGNLGAGSQSAAHNQSIAKTLAAPFGWSTGQQWQDLVSLWNQESGWSNTAMNGSSGAYGIAQALPSTKYPLPGRPPSEGGDSVASVQIAWGLAYILGRYGSPSGAWAHEVANNWY